MNVPSELTVRSAPEGSFVAVPSGTAVPLESLTVATESVAPELGSVSFVSRLPLESVVPSFVENESSTATGSSLGTPVIVMVTVPALVDVSPLSSLTE